ncbi:MAG: transcription termination factor Rho [Bacteroidaceae bacterium]|nr:transcription termination factor Rho [Bacteroidaceae bacterium]
MTQYTYEQLVLVDIETLKSITQELNTPNKSSELKEVLIADILEFTKAESTKVAPPKRKRGRPSKAETYKINEDEILSSINAMETSTSTNVQTIAQENEIETNEKAEENLSINLKPSTKVNDYFYIIKDIPHEENQPSEVQNTDAPSQTKFRKFNEDPIVNNSVEKDAKKCNTEDEKSGSNENSLENIYNDVLLNGRGVLELTKDGYGFLRSSDYNYLTSPDDIYVSPVQLRQYGLKPGDIIEGKVKIPREEDKFFILHNVERINGMTPEEVRNRVAFEHLTPLFPDKKFNLTRANSKDNSCRIVDLFAPIGKGQRALIVAQPKTGKTMLLKSIANAISENHPETYLMMLLIDERPEEVTDMKRTVNAEVIASTFDAPASNHVKIASIVLEKAKRMVECGQDVVIFLDSITRLARAYNTEAPASGKILSGGVDANSLQKPKRFFGAARNIEGGGSLTIIATALIDTGSKMDEVIYEEFKGTGNMELQLDRQLANKRIFPAINLIASSTRRDDLLLNENTINRMWVFRNFLSDMNCIEAMQCVLKQVENTKNNEELLITMSKQ